MGRRSSRNKEHGCRFRGEGGSQDRHLEQIDSGLGIHAVSWSTSVERSKQDTSRRAMPAVLLGVLLGVGIVWSTSALAGHRAQARFPCPTGRVCLSLISSKFLASQGFLLFPPGPRVGRAVSKAEALRADYVGRGTHTVDAVLARVGEPPGMLEPAVKGRLWWVVVVSRPGGFTVYPNNQRVHYWVVLVGASTGRWYTAFPGPW